MNESHSTGRAMIIVISLLYIFTTINLAFNWAFIHSMFVNHGQSLSTVYLVALDPSATAMVMGITSAIFWRCWMVWGRRRLTILLPVLFLVSAMVFKVIGIVPRFDFVLYSSFVLATTLWCTLLIIYRIIATVRTGGASEDGLRAYRRVIVILVESYALYSISLIFYMAFYACGNVALNYFDSLAAISRGIAPTLLVGRVAAGHAHPDDSREGSVMSSLRFDGGQSLTSACEDAATTVMLDLEAQGQINGEYSYGGWTGSQGDSADETIM
ncbi:hypothetical protein EDD18DRAFT_1208751, partial [Armillaria luteobubalina]